MAVRFVLGRAGTGKTRLCLDALLTELARPDDDRHLVLLVPEQAAFQMERAVALRAPGGGYSRAEVLSFSRLARRIFDQTGGEPNVLSSDARRLALRAVVAKSEPDLVALRRAATTAGFFAELGRLIEELLSEGISPENLRSAAERLSDPAARRETLETAEIYANYLAWLGSERIDPAAGLAVLRERLARVAWLPAASLWVDGFAGFTGQELATLVALARLAHDLTITLLLDPAGSAARSARQHPDPLGLFCRTETTYQRLQQSFIAAGLEIQPPLPLQPAVPPRFAGAPQLAALETRLATPTCPADSAEFGTAAVRVLECGTHRDELRAAARWIRAALAEARGALHFRDFAVIARNLTPLADQVADVFEESEIPYFLDRRRPLRTHPLSRLVSALFDAVQTDFEPGTMIRLLRTRLLPVSRDDAEQLENLIASAAVKGVECWRRPTWEFGRGGQSSTAFYPVRQAIVSALEPLLELAAQTESPTGAAWAATVYAVLEQANVRRQLSDWITAARTARRWESAETHRLAWDALCGVLDDLHAALANVRVGLAEVADILASALAELTLGLAPPTVDQVLVGAVERSRHPDIKHAWVLAFNEGLFPAQPAEDLLFSTLRRRTLAAAGLTGLAVHREDVLAERLLAYIAFTRPSQSLTISYAVAGDDGDKLLPSPLLTELRRALPGVAVIRDDPHAPPTHVTELARGFLSVRGHERSVRLSQRYARLCDRIRSAPALAGPLDWALRGLQYINEPGPVGNFRRPNSSAVNVIWDTSPSEIETHLQCPFRHFTKFGLRLEECRGPTPLRWDLGDAAHELLADVTRRALDASANVRTTPDSRWQEWLAVACEAYWQRWPPGERTRRADLAFHTDLLLTLLRDVVAAHAARWRRGRFQPLGCELAFGSAETGTPLPALEFHTPDGARIRVHGKIDRVDIARQTQPPQLITYDYKSSGVGPLTRTFLTGNRLQLFLYLAALAPIDASAQLAGVFLAPLYPALDALDTKAAADADPAAQLMHLYRPRGLVTEAAARRLDDQLSGGSSPVAQFRLKNDGTFYTNCDAKPAAAIEQRLDLAARTVLFATEGIRVGRIDVSPLVENRVRACTRCDFQAVCRFDPVYNPSRAAEAVLPHLEESPADEEGQP